MLPNQVNNFLYSRGFPRVPLITVPDRLMNELMKLAALMDWQTWFDEELKPEYVVAMYLIRRVPHAVAKGIRKSGYWVWCSKSNQIAGKQYKDRFVNGWG